MRQVTTLSGFRTLQEALFFFFFFKIPPLSACRSIVSIFQVMGVSMHGNVGPQLCFNLGLKNIVSLFLIIIVMTILQR